MRDTTRRRWIAFLPLIVIVGLLGVFGKRLLDVEQGADTKLIPTVLQNTPLPAFDLKGMPGRGDERGLKTADLKGEVTLLNVWGSWCPACRVEHPTLMALAREKAVPIHGINWRDKPPMGSPESARAVLEQDGDPYTRIGVDADSDVAIALGVTGAPETFVIDAAGVIRYKQIGPITPEVWRDTLAPLIEKLRQ